MLNISNNLSVFACEGETKGPEDYQEKETENHPLIITEMDKLRNITKTGVV